MALKLRARGLIAAEYTFWNASGSICLHIRANVVSDGIPWYHTNSEHALLSRECCSFRPHSSSGFRGSLQTSKPLLLNVVTLFVRATFILGHVPLLRDRVPKTPSGCSYLAVQVYLARRNFRCVLQ